ncbi:metallophosphoesterase [Bacteroides heparinolyticus]|uniref:metallophosphoesterase n=1 Tax=Prevotella heparinolytica TaxID=28113 RepID=UPI003FA171E6
MHRIILILTLFLFIPDIYIYGMYIVRKTRKRLLRTAYWLPTALLVAGYVYFMMLTGDNAMANHTQGIGRLAIITLLIVVPKTVFMLCSLIGVLAHAVIRRCPRKLFTAIGLILAVVSFFNILYGTLVGTTRFETQETEYRSAALPQGFDGYRIVQISDIHIGSWRDNPEAIDRLTDKVNALKPDLIVFTGDLVNQQSHEIDGFQETLSKLHASDGVFSILGNHDYGDYYRWPSPQAKEQDLAYLKEQQKAMGWKLLNNEHAVLHHKGDSIALIGVENDGEPPFSQHANLSQALKGTDGMFRILLSHNPSHWRREVLPKSDIPLMLAGHTHAMQSIFLGHSLAELIYPEWGGMYYEGSRALYVNIGIGYVGLPFRLGAWPEITVLTLRKNK